MKTWEMIKELGENPEKEFKREDGLVVSTSIDDTLMWESGYTHLNIHDEWEEVKEPVNFMTAVESGKRIKVEHKLASELSIDDLITFSSLDCLVFTLGDIFNTSQVAEIILNGKWYIED